MTLSPLINKISVLVVRVLRYDTGHHVLLNLNACQNLEVQLLRHRFFESANESDQMGHSGLYWSADGANVRTARTASVLLSAPRFFRHIFLK